MPQQMVEFAPEIRVFSRAHELVSQLVERRYQCFRNVASAKLSPMPVLVWFAFCDRRFLHRSYEEAKAFIEELAARTAVMKSSRAW